MTKKHSGGGKHLKEIKDKTNFQPGICHTGKVRIEPNKLKEFATKTVFHVHLLDEPKASRTPYCMSMPCHRLKGRKIFKSRFYVV